MGDIFFTSDNHFFHKNVIRLCDRPFIDLDHMHSEMIERWNKTVKAKDTVYVLGDFSFGSTRQTSDAVNQLNGSKILIRGNHDANTNACLNRGFAAVLEYAEICMGLHNVKLKHFPYKPNLWTMFKPWNRYDLRYMKERPKNDGSWLIHGHTHQKTRFNGKMIHVGVDAWDFTPVPLPIIESHIMRNSK